MQDSDSAAGPCPVSAKEVDTSKSDSDEKDKHRGDGLTRLITLVLTAVRLLVELLK